MLCRHKVVGRGGRLAWRKGGGRRRARAWRACCPAAARLCLGAVRRLGRPVLPVAGFLVAAGVCAFAPGWPSILLGAAAIASRGRIARIPLLPPWRFVHLLLSPLQPLSQPMLLISVMWATFPTCFPGVWRAICYWNRLLPICVRYFHTSKR
ncbi:hypothetical protein DUNSADRAFT_14240 [Dunaliella salina]|uniref:Uncharacterized protein n=1 Tax=Dunaliella salina TaxID=3046 RepID=A0ABQ7G7Q3_DUNSA|nr:hypothetical protein DUNSADRAFT_14240 [Dunaliella salina]|eukprot:KAF5830639.1 hypothetical protein DUNSADRAFT_14240 [Dunaliella salina]